MGKSAAINQSADELARIREEYSDRARRFAGQDVYAPHNPAELFLIQQRTRISLKLLDRAGMLPLKDQRILEVGCGTGGVLANYLALGADPAKLHGTDLLPDRLAAAQYKLPHLPLACCDAQKLPYPSATFDIVIQHTVFSSILSDEVKRSAAAEMLRVLRPGGVVLWYDFWLNPINKQVRGIRPAEIRSLFPNSDYALRRITLAPPILRRLVRRFWFVCILLEQIGLFNTHYLAVIRKR
jgi:SAM-dependent methyltransferase